MINLLPYEEKRQIRASRFNSILLRYFIIMWIGGLFIAAVFGTSYVTLMNTKSSAESLLTANQNKSSAYSSVQQQAEQINSNLSSARNVFSQQILYSKVLIGIAQATPQGVVIDKLTLSPSTFGTSMSLQAYARSSDAALALKNAYQSSPIFSNVSIQNLSGNGSGSSPVAGYPVSITLNVTINKYAAL
jgi:Tfp pilus assembly protein PilN